MPKETLLDRFRADRNVALLSMDETRIREYMAKWRVDMPYDGTMFWDGVHMARVICLDMPDEASEESKTWLRAHGWTDAPEHPFGFRLRE